MSMRFLHGPDDPAFAWVLALYNRAFDRASREPDERLRQELSGGYRLPLRFLVDETTDGLAGFARYCRMPKSGLGWLVHIAVEPEIRGGGVGTRLLRAVVADLAPSPVLVETEPIGGVHDWYVREGFEVLTPSYTQPALHGDSSPVEYVLAARGPIPDRNLAIREFYAEAWELDAGHPFVRRAIET